MMQTEIMDLEVNQSVFFRALGTTFKVMSESLNGSTAVVEHTLEAKSLGHPCRGIHSKMRSLIF